MLSVDAACSLVASGGPSEVPAIEYDKTVDVFQSASNILSEVIPEFKDSCSFEFDGDWNIYPEVGEAWKVVGKDDTCYMVAQCPEMNKWAVGLAGGTKNAEKAAKLALAVAVMADSPPKLKSMCTTYPDFGDFCKSAGLIAGAGKAKYDPEDAADTSWGAPTLPEVFYLDADSVPKIKELGLSGEGPTLEWAKDVKKYFDDADAMLKELTGGNQDVDVKIEHDADWTEYPEVGPMIQKEIGKEVAYAIGTVASAAVFGVGASTNWKGREASTKMALCIAILQKDQEKLEEFSKKFPAFGKLAKSNKLAEGPAAKKAKTK
jgi:hypothetical protein